MSLRINTNVEALIAYNNLSNTNNALNTSISQLSSGLKIQTAADNAAGYVISQNLQTQANGYGVAVSNSQNAVSLIQTASGALGQETAILQNMNQLATQAASTATQSTASSNANQQEFASLQNELTQIASTTQFGGASLLNGTYSGVVQAGWQATAADQVNMSIGGTDAGTLGVGTASINISSGTFAQAAMTAVQAALATVGSISANLGATQNQLQAITNNLTVGQQNLTAANSRLVDVNVAKATSQFTAQQILMQAGTAMLSQAQQLPQLALKLIP